jgi:hypothetical protein
MEIEHNKNTENNEIKKQKHLLNNENYEALKQLQRHLYEETEMTLSMRKLVNHLITEESLEQLKIKMLNVLNNYV